MRPTYNVLSPTTAETTVSSFGGPDDTEDNGKFAFGGVSTMPDGEINPEYYAAFPEELYNKGIVQPGEVYTATNPDTGKQIHVVARDKGPNAKGRGADLAPHALKALGAETDDHIQFDFTPVGTAHKPATGPSAEDYIRPSLTLAGVDTSIAPDPSIPTGGLASSSLPTDLTPINDAMSDSDSESAANDTMAKQDWTQVDSTYTPMIPKVKPNAVKENTDGSVLFDDGTTAFPDGHIERKMGGDLFAYTPEGKVYKVKQPQEDTRMQAGLIAGAIMKGDQPPTLQGLYRHGPDVRAELAKQGYDLASAQMDWKATERHLSTLNGPQQTRLRQATQFSYDSLDIIDELAKQWKGGNFPILNKASLIAAKNGLSGPEAQSLAVRLDAQISDLVSDLAVVYQGGNSPISHSLELASSNLKSDWSERTLLDATQLARRNLQIRLNSLKSTGVAGASKSNPYVPAQETTSESGPPSSSPAPQPSAPPQGPDIGAVEAEARRRLAIDPNDPKALEVLRRLGK